MKWRNNLNRKDM